MSTYAINPFAPDYFYGINQPPKDQVGYEDRTHKYIYDPPSNQLTANQHLVDSLSINPRADFILLAWYIALFTGEFEIQLVDATGYEMMSGFENSGAISKSSADPTVFCPSHPFPAGGKILIKINDLSGQTNPLQIVFVGKDRYRVKF